MAKLWIVDVEASGLSPNSYPIEVGLYNGRDEYQAFIVPEKAWHYWNLKAEAMHGISRKTLFEKGKPARVVAKELNALLGTNVIYTDHEDWDGFWLKRLFDAAVVKPRFIVADLSGLLNDDTAGIYVAAFDELSRREDYQAHRALDDAQVIHGAVSRALV